MGCQFTYEVVIEVATELKSWVRYPSHTSVEGNGTGEITRQSRPEQDLVDDNVRVYVKLAPSPV